MNDDRTPGRVHEDVLSMPVDRIIPAAELVESVHAEAAWYAARPGYAEAAEAERHAAG